MARPTLGSAQGAAPTFDEIGPYLMTMLLFLVDGFVVFWMAAGFAVLEAGLVRLRNVTTQLTKNIALFSFAGIMYWLVGFYLMKPGADGWIIQSWVSGVITDVRTIFANTNMTASAGAVTALIRTQLMFGKVDLTVVLNGALAGVVSIAAGALDPSLFGALWIGAVGGVIVVLVVPMLDQFQIDDVVGAIPVYLLAEPGHRSLSRVYQRLMATR